MEKKVYNLKDEALGKLDFPEGSIFFKFSMETKEHGVVNEMLILPSIEEAVKRFSSWSMEKAQLYVKDFLGFHNQIVDWLIENWMNPGIMTLKEEMYQEYGFPEFKDLDPVEWIKSEPEMVSLCLAHITAKLTNGYLKLPFYNMELTIKFVKTIIGVNFWEEGNPFSSEPTK